MEGKLKFLDEAGSSTSLPKPSTRSPSPQPNVSPRLSEASVTFLENLEIGDLIGQGSFGKVYIGWHTQKKQEYAVKKIQLDHLSPCQYDLVIDEVTNMLSVDHPGLLKLEDSIAWNTYVVDILPLMAYTSCDQIIRNAYPNGLPEPAIGLIIKDVLNAVTYLHSRNIIHRTIKASHILIRESGSAVLSGFRHMLPMPHNQERMTVHTNMSEMSQYINWISPEMLLQDSRGFGLNSDMYSIGITICELGNGVVPYSYVSPSGILVKKLEEPPPKLWDKNFLPSNEPSGAASSFCSDAQSSPEQVVYERKCYSQHIKKFVSLCTIASPETRITSEQAVKCKFYTQYSKESPSATLRNLPQIGPPVRYTAKSGGPASVQAAYSSHSAETTDWDWH